MKNYAAHVRHFPDQNFPWCSFLLPLQHYPQSLENPLYYSCFQIQVQLLRHTNKILFLLMAHFWLWTDKWWAHDWLQIGSCLKLSWRFHQQVSFNNLRLSTHQHCPTVMSLWLSVLLSFKILRYMLGFYFAFLCSPLFHITETCSKEWDLQTISEVVHSITL